MTINVSIFFICFFVKEGGLIPKIKRHRIKYKFNVCAFRACFRRKCNFCPLETYMCREIQHPLFWPKYKNLEEKFKEKRINYKRKFKRKIK